MTSQTQLSVSLSAADLTFIQGFQDTLRRDINGGRDYGGLLTAILRRLESFCDAKVDGADSPSWGPVLCVPGAESSAQDKISIRISGPFPDDHFEILMVSSQDVPAVVRYVSALDIACQKLEEIRGRSLAVTQKEQELRQERSSLSQPAEITVDDHIRLLRQYNKTKDVGQQLIGLIAESRGEALGSVYKNSEYGVSADD